MPSRSKPAIAAAVAVFLVLASLAEGGYSVESRAILALLAWSAVLLGILLGVFPRSRTPASALVAGSLLAVVATLSAASVLWGGDDGAAINECIRVSAYLGLFALVVCASREGETRSWLTGLALGIVAVAAIALLSRLIPAFPGGDEEITEFLPAARGRLSYPILYWNALAALLGLGVVLLSWFGAFARSLPGRSAATAAIPMLGLALYLTSSRGGLAALLAGVVVLVAIGPRRPALIASLALGGIGAGLAIALASGQTDLLDAATAGDVEDQGLELLGATVACMAFTAMARAVADGALSRLRFSRRAAVAIVAVSATALLAGAIAADPSERFEEFKSVPAAEEADDSDFIASHLQSGNGSGRWQFWGEALDAFASEPVLGLGAGGYGNYWNQHAPIDQVVKSAHSLYFEQLAELGPLGLLALLAFVLLGPIRGLRNRAAFPAGEVGAAVALVATGAISAAVDWTWEVPAVFGPVVIVLALLSGAPFSLPDGDSPDRRPGRGLRLGWVIAVAGVACVSLLLAATSLLTERNLDASREAAADKELGRAATEARAAIALEPWAEEPRLQLALVQESAGELDAAERAIGEAIDRAPDDWRPWIVRTRIAILDSRLDDARAAFDEARRLNPRAPIFTGLQGPLER